MASVGICQAICLVFEPDVMKSLRSVGRGLTRSRTALAGGGRAGNPIPVASLGCAARPVRQSDQRCLDEAGPHAGPAAWEATEGGDARPVTRVKRAARAASARRA